jgi:hypothetical protein
LDFSSHTSHQLITLFVVIVDLLSLFLFCH